MFYGTSYWNNEKIRNYGGGIVMEIRYAVRIEDVFDVRKNKGFLEEMYEDLFQLYQRKYFLLNVYHENDKKIRVLDFKIKGKLREYNLPEVIVFEGEEGMSRVREFISKGELFLPFPVLEKYRITRYAEKNSSYYFNIYEPDDIMQLYNDFSIFCQNKDKVKIVDMRLRK